MRVRVRLVALPLISLPTTSSRPPTYRPPCAASSPRVPAREEALSTVRPCILTYLCARGSSQWRHCAPEIWAGDKKCRALSMPSYGRALCGVPNSLSYTVTPPRTSSPYAVAVFVQSCYSKEQIRKPSTFLCAVAVPCARGMCHAFDCSCGSGIVFGPSMCRCLDLLVCD